MADSDGDYARYRSSLPPGQYAVVGISDGDYARYRSRY
jgi:hypothetical protein